MLAGAAVINAVTFSPLGDEWFFAIALLGPLLTGLAVGLREGDLPAAAAAWVLTGLCWLVVDWIVNAEDRLFHIVLAIVMGGLVALGGVAGRSLRRVPRTQPGYSPGHQPSRKPAPRPGRGRAARAWRAPRRGAS